MQLIYFTICLYLIYLFSGFSGSQAWSTCEGIHPLTPVCMPAGGTTSHPAPKGSEPPSPVSDGPSESQFLEVSDSLQGQESYLSLVIITLMGLVYKWTVGDLDPIFLLWSAPVNTYRVIVFEFLITNMFRIIIK